MLFAPLALALAAPAMVPTDARDAVAQPLCTAGIAAVGVHGGAATGHVTVAKAFEAVADGDLLWVCPGVHLTAGTLRLDKRSKVRIAGRDALVALPDNAVVLSIEGGADVTLDGVGWTHATEPSDCASDTVVARGTQRLTVRGSGFHGSGVVGLHLFDVQGATVSGSTFVQCDVGLSRQGGTAPVLVGNRFVDNDAHLDAGAPRPKGNHFGRLRAKGSAPEVDWADLLARAPAVPTTSWQGDTYVVLEVKGYAEFDDGVCKPDELGGCTQAMPLVGDAPAHPASTAESVQVPSAKGLCTATLGPVVRLGIKGCDMCLTIARKMTGCADGAPLAFAGEVYPALRWQPRVDVSKAQKAALDAWLDGRLKDDVITRPMLPELTRAVHWEIPAPQGTLSVRAAGVQFDLPECNLIRRRWVEASLGGAPLEMPERAMTWEALVGGLVVDGHLVAAVGQGPTNTVIFGRTPGGLSKVWDGTYFEDNGECLGAPGPVDFAFPCGP